MEALPAEKWDHFIPGEHQLGGNLVMDASILGCLGQNVELIGNWAALLRWEGHKPTVKSPRPGGWDPKSGIWGHWDPRSGNCDPGVPRIHSFAACSGDAEPRECLNLPRSCCRHRGHDAKSNTGDKSLPRRGFDVGFFMFSLLKFPPGSPGTQPGGGSRSELPGL